MLRLREDYMLWPDGKEKCLTLSFDDGTKEDERICELLRERGLRATFNLNPGLFGSDDHLVRPGTDVWHRKLPRNRILDVYKGFEIAVHGYTHASMTVNGSAMAAYEIVRAKEELEELAHAPVRGMAWPIRFEGKGCDDVCALARACGISYGRTTKRTYSCRGVPGNVMTWNPTCSYVEPQLADMVESFLSVPRKEDLRNPYLLFVWGHGYEATSRNAWGVLEGFFDDVACKDDVWYATNIEVCDYLTAYRSLVYSSTGSYLFNPSYLDVWLLIDGERLVVPSGKTINVPVWREERLENDDYS